MKKNNLVLIIIVSLIIVIFTSVYFLNFNGITGKATKDLGKDKIILAHGKWILTAPIFIAEEKGFFEDENLDIEFKYFASGRDDLQAVLGGAADIGTVAETPLVFGGFNDIDVYVIGTFMKTDVNNKVVARKDLGINKIEDLKGKKIAILFGTSSEYFSKEFLRKNNIPENEIQLINLEPQQMVTSLVRKDIDAFIIWEPNRYEAKKLLKDNFIEFEDRDIVLFTYNFVTRKDYTLQNNDKLVRFFKAIKKANNYIKENKKDSIEITSKYTGLDKDFLNEAWDDFIFQLNLDSNLVTLMETQAKWAIDSGLVKEQEIPNYNEMIYDELINKVKNGK